MANQKFYPLQSNEFESNIKTSWQELETDKDFCDVTLACDDKQIKAHKLIISSSSPVQSTSTNLFERSQIL